MKAYMIIILIFFQINLYSKVNDITLKLSWLNQFQSAGFYVAKEKGFYKKENLHVNILEYNHSNIVDEVLENKIDFGIGRSSLLINKHKNLAILMPVFQSSPAVIITTNPQIKAIKDFRNKHIMITKDEINSASILTMLLTAGLRKDDFTEILHTFNLQDLIDKKTDAMASYITNEPYLLKKKNIDFKVFNPRDYGYDFYGDLLFTSQKNINQNPKVVKKFYEASKAGWLYAFNNIEETAKIIYDKYNTQHKSLDHLIFEGKELKKLAFDSNGEFGKFHKEKIDKILNIYKLFDFIPKNFTIDGLINPLGFDKKHIYIGVLAKRGDNIASIEWAETIKYLNEKITNNFFHIIPLNFDEIENAIKSKKIDFLFTNTSNYVQMEYKYKISRIATLLNKNILQAKPIKEFGSVIFAKKERNDITNLQNLEDKKIAAVNENSFGGWVMAKKELIDHNVNVKYNNVRFLNTHDAVVYSVQNDSVDVGIIRTDILEKMQKENKINLNDYKIIGKKKYDNFPYLVSTELYPEWPFSKLNDTLEDLSLQVLQTLLSICHDPQINSKKIILGWTIPQNYTKVNFLLEKLEMYPYDTKIITLEKIYKQYQFQIYIAIMIFITILFYIIYTKKVNLHLQEFNKKLENQVLERTQKLHLLATTDELTKIDNRRSFFEKATQYIELASRNNSPLFYIAMDIDFFKKINDTYGHIIGDKVLIHFTKTVQKNLRKSDIFGRVGGEEFSICIQNTSIQGAKTITEKN